MKLSIITINLNNAIGLQKTISSVLCQTIKDFEFIIIDGASTDGSIEIIKQNEAGIDYWLSEPDTGIYNAMNKGLKIAKGEYVQFLNSGDYLYSDAVLMSLCNELDGTDILYGDVIIEQDGQHVRKFYDEISLLGILERSSHLCHQAVFMSRTSIEKAGGRFDEKFKILSDWKLLVEALVKNSATFKPLKTVIVNYDKQGISSKNESIKLINEEYFKILKDDYPLFYNDFIKMNSRYRITYSDVPNSFYFKLAMRLKKIATQLMIKRNQ